MSARTEERRARIAQAVRSNSPALLAYFARRVTPAHDAADLLSETLLVVWKRAASLPASDEEIRPWMFGIARHVLMHHDRSMNRRRALTDRLRGELAVASRPGFDGSPVFDDLREALGSLDQVDRDIIGLVHWEGFSLVEVARIVRMKESTVRSRYHRARTRLRARLTPVSEAAPVAPTAAAGQDGLAR